MKYRSLYALMLICSLLLPAAANAQSGEKSVGLRGGYTTATKSPVAGLFFQYRFSKYFRLAPSAEYYFRHHGTDAYTINLDAQVPFAFSVSSRFNIYPLGGLNLTSYNYRYRAEESTDDSSTRKTRFGLNLGGGLEYYVTPSLKLSVEAKYVLIKKIDGGNFTASIGYVF